MPELLVQTYLRSGKTLEELKTEHGVKSYLSNGKLGLNYDMLEASNTDQLACQCRGLILEPNTFDVIACPFFRFFNMDQGEIAANIDWESAEFLEKMDGTLIVVANFNDRWFCGTRGRPDADGSIEDSEFTFTDLVDITIDRMLKDAGHDKKSNLNEMMSVLGSDVKNYTFMFELTSPFNRIVCKYDEPKLTLLGVRDNYTLKELDPKLFDFGIYGIKTPTEYSFSNINHMIQVIREWNPEEHEGIVVRDKHFNRIKVKNPSYLAFNHLKNSLSSSLKGCVEVILLGKDDDVIPMMPQMIGERIVALKPIIQKVLIQTESDYNELKDISNMKEFALQAKQKLWDSALFALKRNKTPDLKTYALGNSEDKAKIPNNAVEKMLELCIKIDPTAINNIKNLKIHEIE